MANKDSILLIIVSKFQWAAGVPAAHYLYFSKKEGLHMQGGFSFCGVDIAKFGLEYVPPLDQTYVFAGSEYNVHQETFDAHHGGYFYGTTVRPKDFILKCFYQDLHIAHGALASIEGFFRRGRTGKLVFDRRDWVWYTATVVGIDFSDLRNYQNGFVTITLRAYYPFARHDYISLCDHNMVSNHIAANSGLLSEDETPPTQFQNITQDMNFKLYNGGSERASVAIALAGNAGEDGIMITNHTTGQTAKFVVFDKAKTTNANKYIVCDGLNGKTVLTDGIQSERAFLYHDHGFIELAPSYPVYRDVYITYNEGSNMVTVTGTTLCDDIVGRYIMLNNAWHKIIDSFDSILTLDYTAPNSGATFTDIVIMNDLSVTLTAGAELTKLEFIYKPTFQ